MPSIIPKIYAFAVRLLPSYRQRTHQIRLSETLEAKFDDMTTLLKRSILMKDDVFEFIYYDQKIKFYLPYAGIDYAQSCILSGCNFYEEEYLRFCLQFIDANSVIIDAGANIGNHSLFFGKFCRAEKIYSFEPQRNVFEILKKNIDLNQIDNVTLHNCALGEACGFSEISNAQSTKLGEVSYKPCNDEKCNSINTISVDSLLLKRLDFMKIDVEGAQLSVLKGASRTIDEFHPLVWIEMNQAASPESYSRENEVELPTKFLQSKGYVLKTKMGPNDYLFEYKSPGGNA